MIKQEDLWGGLGCLEGTFLGRVKNIAGEPRGSEGLVQRSSCSSWYPAQSTHLYLTNMPGTRLIWGMWHALARGDTWDTAVPWGGMHTLPQPRPLMTINEISKCYRIQRGCSCCAHPTFCSLLSQNLRTHLAAVVFPQEAVVLLVPYRPSPNTDYSYLAHRRRNWVIKTSAHLYTTALGEIPFRHILTPAPALEDSVSETPQNMLSSAMKRIPGTACKTFIHFPGKYLQGPCRGIGWMLPNRLHLPYNDISSDLNATAPPINPPCSPHRGNVECWDDGARDRIHHSYTSRK